MHSLMDVLSLLKRVQSLRFDACSEAETGWDGVGAGDVAVSMPQDGVVVFEESGTWQPRSAGRASLGFTNVFRWSVVGEALRLEHLRFGVEHSVLLFDMAPAEDGVWREVAPHQCKEDCYTASLTVENEQLVVAWSIVGPHKRESIRYVYSVDA